MDGGAGRPAAQQLLQPKQYIEAIAAAGTIGHDLFLASCNVLAVHYMSGGDRSNDAYSTGQTQEDGV